jgi:hypothetical protein
MKRSALFSLATSLLLMVPPSTPAHGEVRLGLGGDYVSPDTGMFELLLSIDARLSAPLRLGGRGGVLLLSTPQTFGIPLDVDVRWLLLQNRVYLQALAGPWVLFQPHPVRLHLALGAGIQTEAISFGLEGGYLHPGAHIGMRLAVGL